MTVAAILRSKGSEVVSVAPRQRLADVARVLVRHRIGAVLVRDDGGPALGILSERDIVRVLAEDEAGLPKVAAADAMTPVRHTVGPTVTVTEALALMTDRRVRHLPVLEGGTITGIVSIGDLVKARIEDAVGEASALRDYVAAG